MKCLKRNNMINKGEIRVILEVYLMMEIDINNKIH